MATKSKKVTGKAATEVAETKKKRTKKSEAAATTPAKTKTKKSAKAASPAKAKTKAKSDLPKPIKEKMTKTQLIEHLAEQSGTDKKEVKAVMAALEDTMLASVRKKSAGEFMFPGLFKVVTKHIPKKKGGEKKISFGKEIITKAKPATTRIKVRPMKKLKDAAVE